MLAHKVVLWVAFGLPENIDIAGVSSVQSEGQGFYSMVPEVVFEDKRSPKHHFFFGKRNAPELHKILFPR
jgi:hypothetical protein